MMMSVKFPFFIFLFLFSWPSWPLSLDWSGWSRVEGYYQYSPDHHYYGSYHLVLQPNIHVVDGLNITGRLDLNTLGKSPFSPSAVDRQTGFVFVYGENSNPRDLEFHPLFLSLSQIYMDYQSEFFKIRLGRAPYHFGMGLTYFASEDPFQHWISVHNQVALYLEHPQFYIQPAILNQKDGSFVGLAQAGFLNEGWKLSALYQHDFKKNSFLEAFGQYGQNNWEVQGSASYAFQEQSNMLIALEALIQVPTKIPFQLEIHTGGAFGELSFHPNYDVALLFWNRRMSPLESKETETNPFQMAEGQIHSGVYFSPRLLFSFLDDRFKIRPLLLLARDLEAKKWNYELNLEGMYQLEESLFLSLQGGALYIDSKLKVALLAQAAVSF